jgi:hypothetical protein
MIDTEACKKYVPLGNKLYRIKGFIVTDVRELTAGVIHMQKPLPLFWSFITSLQAKKIFLLL